MSQRIAAHPVYLLHRRALRESTDLLELFSSQHGRITVARRVSRRDHDLQAFTPLAVAWAGRGEVPTVSSLEALGPGLRLTGRRLLAGLYLNELLVHGLPRGEAQGPLYARYVQSLAALSEGELEWPLRLFEYDLLQALGYGGSAAADMAEPAGANYTPLPARAHAALKKGEPALVEDLPAIKRYLAGQLARHVLSREIRTRDLLRVC